MLKYKLEKDLQKIIKDLGLEEGDTVCDIPRNSDFGDYTSNIVLQLAKQTSDISHQSSDKIASEISEKLQSLEYVEKAEVAGVGFINIWIKPEALLQNLQKVCNYTTFVDPKFQLEEKNGRSILVEFAHPNTHKPFHIGHIRNLTIGESLSRLLEAEGNQIFRANYQGDIGLHVAKAIWGVKKLGPEYKKVEKADAIKKADFLGKAYALGATTYEGDEQAKKEILDINKRLYAKDSELIDLWQTTRQWSLDYFDYVYQKMGTAFNRLYFESEVEQPGKKMVLDNMGKIFLQDQGAVIFKGEQYGLHNRVFITSEGNPTYEAKEIGLAEIEYKEFKYDRAIHVVANEQEGYLQVLFKAAALIFPELEGKKQHLSYGMVNLKGGKMSSRTGNVITFDWVFNEVSQRVKSIMEKSTKKTKETFADGELNQIIDAVSIGAIKFTMLKYSPATNIIFDLEKSVALDGDSGPYVQYTYSRAKSVLRKGSYSYQPAKLQSKDFEKEERQILQKIEHFESVVSQAAQNYQPNLIANFVLELARLFNLFYQKHPVLNGGEKQELRLALTCAVAVTLKQGLYLLGIETVERM